MSLLTERIIEMVQKYPILYDPSHPESKNLRKKDRVWREIGLELQEHGDEIKKKWRNLKDTYAKYIKSNTTTTRKPAKKNYKNWQWSQQMEVFRPFLAFAQTDTNVRDIKEEITYEYNEISEADPMTELFDSEYCKVEPIDSLSAVVEQKSEIQSRTSIPSPSQSNIPSSTKSNSSTQSSRLNRNKRRKKCQDNEGSPVDAAVSSLKSKRTRDEKTANDMIFSGYAKTVDSFSPKRQAITRMKIAQIIARQELKHIEEMQSLSRPSHSPHMSQSLAALQASSEESNLTTFGQSDHSDN